MLACEQEHHIRIHVLLKFRVGNLRWEDTAHFLLQFLEIQRKSIGEYGDWLSRLELAGDDKCAILIIDKELGA